MIASWFNRWKSVRSQAADRFTLVRFKVGAKCLYVPARGKMYPARIVAIGADAGLGEATLGFGLFGVRLDHCFFNPHTKNVGTWHWE